MKHIAPGECSIDTSKTGDAILKKNLSHRRRILGKTRRPFSRMGTQASLG